MTVRKTTRPTRLMALGVLALLPVAVARADVRVVGTDLLGVNFSKALYAFAGRHDLTVALAFDGSRPGLDQLKAGRADLALLVFAPGEESSAAGLESVTLAYHRVVVLVPAASPLERVTLEQLGGIFGVGGSVGVSRWDELGLGGEWAGSTIAPQVPAVGHGFAAEYFRHAVLHDRAFRSIVTRYEAPADLVLRLAGNSRAIALAPTPPPGPGLKIVSIATRANEPAFLPTAENLHSGDYPLRLPLNLVFRRASARPLLPLWRFLFGDEAAPLLVGADLVPLPSAARRQQVLALEKL
jgi:hypothetical protein